MGEPTSSEYIRVTTDWSTPFLHGGAAVTRRASYPFRVSISPLVPSPTTSTLPMATLAAQIGGSGAACVQHCAAAPFTGSDGSADFVCRASPVRREGGRSGHAAPPPQASATTSTRRRRPRWNSGSSVTRWITAPLPRPADQPGATNTASTTTTTAPETLLARGTLQHKDMPSLHGSDPQQHQPLASPSQAAAQTAALILVAAQHDISRRDGVIDTLKHRWWQQLCSRQIATVQRRRLLALRCTQLKAQQLEGTSMTKTIERLQRQVLEQAMELTRLRNRPIPSAPQGSVPSQHDDPSYIS